MVRPVLLCVVAFCMAGCGGARPGIGEPPAGLGGGAWVRDSIERPGLDAAPEAVKRYQPKEWLRTQYRKGDSVVRVNIYRMPGEPSAFEARQKWLGESGTASMNHGDLFVVVASASEPAQGLGQFLRLMEAEWLNAPAH